MRVYKSLGQIGYEAYSESAEGHSLVTGDELPEWDKLSPDIRNAWEIAAMAIAARVRGDAGEAEREAPQSS